jgi:hypothetical protein
MLDVSASFEGCGFITVADLLGGDDCHGEFVSMRDRDMPATNTVSPSEFSGTTNYAQCWFSGGRRLDRDIVEVECPEANSERLHRCFTDGKSRSEHCSAVSSATRHLSFSRCEESLVETCGSLECASKASNIDGVDPEANHLAPRPQETMDT